MNWTSRLPVLSLLPFLALGVGACQAGETTVSMLIGSVECADENNSEFSPRYLPAAYSDSGQIARREKRPPQSEALCSFFPPTCLLIGGGAYGRKRSRFHAPCFAASALHWIDGGSRALSASPNRDREWLLPIWDRLRTVSSHAIVGPIFLRFQRQKIRSYRRRNLGFQVTVREVAEAPIGLAIPELERLRTLA